MGRLKRGARTRPVREQITAYQFQLQLSGSLDRFVEGLSKLGDAFVKGVRTGLVAREPVEQGSALYVQPSLGLLGSAIVPNHVARVMQEQVLAAADDKIKTAYRDQAEAIFAQYANPRPGRRIYIDGKDMTEEITAYDFKYGPLKPW